MDSTNTALNTPKVLKRILSFLPSKDKLTARMVCVFWRDQAFWIFREQDLPSIVSGPGSVFKDNQTPLKRFLAKFQTGNGLPLTIYIDKWNRLAILFLERYSTSIVRVVLMAVKNLPEFTLDDNNFNLPNLMSTELCLCVTGKYGNYENEMIQDAVLLWEEIMSGAEEESIKICGMKAVALQRTCAQVVPVVLTVPRKLKSLALQMRDDKTSVYFNPAQIFEKRTDDPNSNQLIFYNLDNLNELGFKVETEAKPCVNFGLVQGLRAIKFQGKCVLGAAEGTTPLAKLMPNLEKIDFQVNDRKDYIRLTDLGITPFEALETLKYTVERSGHEESMACARQINLFPNLKELVVYWDTVNHATPALHYLASQLIHLEKLEINVCKMKEDDDLVKMLTGLGQDEIPEDETKWSQSLDGKTNAICNLPNLKSFSFTNEGASYLMDEKGLQFLMSALARPKRMKLMKVVNVKQARWEDGSGDQKSGEYNFQAHGRKAEGNWQKLC